MRFPRWYARWNRLATNKLFRLWAGWVPAMGLLSHAGRRSGRVYRTPLNVFPTADGVAIFLPYGAETTEWLKNVQAAGGAQMQRYGKTFRVSQPRVVPKSQCQIVVAARWRPIYALAPFSETLLLTRTS
ncbi:MAG: nitroreductase family deazaflavin-dependent oxidoreductase [Mycobacterium sp.]